MWLAFKINYPPTEEQLRYLSLFGQTNNVWGLWGLRFCSFGLILGVLFLWYKFLDKKFGIKSAMLGMAVTVIIPTLFVSWLTSPFLCLRLFVATSVLFLVTRKKKVSGVDFLIVLVAVFLIGLAGYGFKASIFHKLSFSDAQKEVTEWISTEDSLIRKIDLPLLWRRISYNKIFFEYKVLINEIVKFLDLEAIFFQEIHPEGQKSIVLFFWPEVFFFLFGLWMYKTLEIEQKRLFVLLWASAFVGFLFTEGAAYEKFILVIFPVAATLAIGMAGLEKRKVVWAPLFFLTFYGWITIVSDMGKRPDFWLDNRPLAYRYFFENLAVNNFSDYDQIYVTTMVGNPRLYCGFYLGNCKNFVYESFSFKEKRPEGRVVYAGFAGEFVGSDLNNLIASNWRERIVGLGFDMVDSISLRDTIAYRFGNDLVVAYKK